MSASAARLAADRAHLAEVESEIASDMAGPYAAQTAGALRRRVARYETAQSVRPSPSAPPPRPAPAAAPPPDRATVLRRLAAAMGASAEELSAALAADVSPDAFALMLCDGTAVDRVVRRVLSA